MLVLSILFVSLTYVSAFNLASLLKSPSAKRTEIKSELLDLCKKTQRGLIGSSEEASRIKALFEQLEALNSDGNTLKSPFLNGTWVLEYTTSENILGKNGKGKGISGPVKVGEILQLIGKSKPFDEVILR
jgi:hypothetical protein